ncbi:hypothetical protein TNCV_1837891 [Trichonephila clavipes]|nr:hypothetical protein TNCV_1837891 [Trichonephila clavipes]
MVAPFHAIHGAADVDRSRHYYTCSSILTDYNCLKELYGDSPPCGAGVDRRALMLPSVIHRQFFELFGALMSIASKLASLRNCATAHDLLLCNRNILLAKGR